MNENKSLPLDKYLVMFLLFLVITGSTLFFIVKLANEGSGITDISSIGMDTLVILIGLMIILTVVDGLRLYQTLKSLKIDLRYPYVLRQSIIGVFMSNVTPFLAGGSFAQIYFLSKKGVHTGDAAAAATIKSLIASGFFMIGIPIALLLDRRLISYGGNERVLTIAITAIIVLYVFILYFVYKLMRKPQLIEKYAEIIIGFLYKRRWIDDKKRIDWTNKIIREALIFEKHVIRFFSSGIKNVLKVFAITIAYYLILFSFSVVLIKALGYDLGILQIIGAQMVANFIMYFAFTPGASGFAEGGYALIFSKLLMEEDVVLVMFMWRLFSVYIISLVGMVLFLIELKISRKDKYRIDGLGRS